MRHLFPLIVAALVFFSSLCAPGQEPKKGDLDEVPVIASSGDVEIASIRIVRERASGAAKEADLTKMQIDLWFTRKAETGKPGQYLIKLLELGPVEDDTGKVLSTKKRLEGIEYFKGEVIARATQVARGKEGPSISMTLEAPARQATLIKSLKGKGTLSRSVFARIQFEDLSAIEGRILDHPKLKAFPIRPSIKVENGDTVLTLIVPRQSARLLSWGLGRKGKLLAPIMESKRLDVDGLTDTLEMTYRGDYSKTAFLGIVIAEPNETKAFEFEFKNIELP